jgi:hypothetical protein
MAVKIHASGGIPSPSQGRNVVRTSDGTRWLFVRVGDVGLVSYYSKDRGATWTASTNVANTATTNGTEASVFIDSEDRLYLGMTQMGTGSSTYIAYAQVYTPNADRTTWTKVASYHFGTSTSSNVWQITGGIAAYPVADTNLARIAVGVYSTGGGHSTRLLHFDKSTNGISQIASVAPGPSPSIEMQHTGDGKTPSDALADFYTLAHDGLLQTIVVGGTATSPTFSLASKGYLGGGSSSRSSLSVQPGRSVAIAGTTTWLKVSDHDQGSTWTALPDPPLPTGETVEMRSIDVSVDRRTSDVYVVISNGDTSRWRTVYSRSTGTWSAITKFATTSGTSWVSSRSVVDDHTFDYIWVSGGTTDEAGLYYEHVFVNAAPSAPGAFTSPTGGEVVNTTDPVECGAASDPDDDSLTYEWDLSLDNGANWTRKRNLSTGTSWTYDYTNDRTTTAAKWRVRAHDGSVYGPYRESDAFTVQHAPYVPRIML